MQLIRCCPVQILCISLLLALVIGFEDRILDATCGPSSPKGLGHQRFGGLGFKVSGTGLREFRV